VFLGRKQWQTISPDRRTSPRLIPDVARVYAGDAEVRAELRLAKSRLQSSILSR
jgi:hypothetical protein